MRTSRGTSVRNTFPRTTAEVASDYESGNYQGAFVHVVSGLSGIACAESGGELGAVFGFGLADEITMPAGVAVGVATCSFYGGNAAQF